MPSPLGLPIIPFEIANEGNRFHGIMSQRHSRLERAFAQFDRINASDPRMETVAGAREPKELLYARRMSERLDRFEPQASEALRLAIRAQHIARWEIPRSAYPEGRSGYKRWRTRLMQHHADLAGRILAEVGYDEVTIERVATLLRKQGLKRDPEVQVLEDVVCLVFLEHYLDDFAESHDDEKLVGILRKTWVKMSERGRSAALELPLSERASSLIESALGDREAPEPPKTKGER